MSEVRGIPKRSKTVVFIVIFVFFQVLALAIVGLLALRESQETQAQEARDAAAERGLSALQSLRDRALKAVAQQLRETNQIRTFAQLEALRERHARPIARRLFRVDGDGTLWWLDREVRVDRPPALVKEDADRARPLASKAAAEAREAGAAQYGSAEAFAMWSRFLDRHPLYLGAPDRPSYPWAVVHARAMLDDYLIPAARSRRELRPLPGPVRRGVLQSLEIEALNRVRVGTDIDPLDVADTLDRIDGAVNRVLAQIPEELRVGLSAEVAGYRATRSWIRDDTNRRALEGVLAGVAERTARPDRPVLQLQANGDIFAVSTDESHPAGFAVIQLDPAAVTALIQAEVDPSQLDPYGLEIRVVGPEGDHEGAPDTRIHRVDVRGPGMDLPGFVAAVFRVREVAPGADDRSELVFWGIITFAVLGFLFGTWVLVRLMTREVRLAQLKADFVGNLSHELKTPLTSIGLFTEMLAEGKLRSEEDKAEAYDVLAQEAQRLQRIVQRMIDVARKEAQGVAYSLGPGDFNDTVRQAIERFERIVTEPGLDLVVDISREPLPMLLDAQAMDDVVTNLLSNAWKYKQGSEARVLVRTRRRGGSAELVVSDDGIGIPRAERKRVFEMFYRADQLLTQPVSGTGLGLALVRTIVRGHKGRIQIGPGENGRGTSFRLRFPLSREAQDALLATQIPPQNGDPLGGAHGTMGGGAEKTNQTGAM